MNAADKEQLDRIIRDVKQIMAKRHCTSEEALAILAAKSPGAYASH